MRPSRFSRPSSSRITQVACLAAALALCLPPARASQPGAGEPRHFAQLIVSWSRGGVFFPEFVLLVDHAREVGIDTIKFDWSWKRSEPDPGLYDFSELVQKLDYVILTSGMNAIVMISAEPPSWVDASLLQRRPDGTIIFSPEKRVVTTHYIRDRVPLPSFSSGQIRTAFARYHRALVEHCQGRYPAGSILFFTSNWTPSIESEYWWEEYSDYASPATREFRAFLQGRVGGLNALNARWGTTYTSYSEVGPWHPDEDTGARPEPNLRYFDWQAYRHVAIKRLADEMLEAIREGDLNAMTGLQFGSTFDNQSGKRGTYGFADIAARADWVTIDTAPLQDHAYAMDLLRGTLQDARLAMEIDGPEHPDASNEVYRNQGLTAYAHGARVVELANWEFHNGGNQLDPALWPFLDDMVDAAAEPTSFVNASGLLEVSVHEHLLQHEKNRYLGNRLRAYADLSSGGTVPIDVLQTNDLALSHFPTLDTLADSFEAAPLDLEPPIQWESKGGNWSRIDGRYVQSKASGRAQSGPPDARFGNSRLEATLQFVTASGSWAGFQIRTLSPNDVYQRSGYLVRLRPDGFLALYSADTKTVVAAAQTGLDPVTNPVHLAVRGYEDRITVWAEGVRQIDWTDPAQAFTSGGFHLVALHSQVAFDDVRLTPVAAVFDDFDDGDLTGWDLYDGSWSNGSGRMSQEDGAGYSAAAIDGRTFHDGTLSFRLRITAGGEWAGVHVRKASPHDTYTQSGYLVYVRPNGTVGLHAAGHGLITEVSPSISPTLFFVDFAITVDGSLVRVSVNGSQAIEWVDPSYDPGSAGYLGLATLNAQATFDDVRFEIE